MQYLQSSIAKGATETPPQRKINEWTTSSTQEINIPDIQRIDTFFQQRVGSHHKIGVEPVLAFVKYESAVHNTETLSGGITTVEDGEWIVVIRLHVAQMRRRDRKTTVSLPMTPVSLL